MPDLDDDIRALERRLAERRDNAKEGQKKFAPLTRRWLMRLAVFGVALALTISGSVLIVSGDNRSWRARAALIGGATLATHLFRGYIVNVKSSWFDRSTASLILPALGFGCVVAITSGDLTQLSSEQDHFVHRCATTLVVGVCAHALLATIERCD